MNSLRRRNCLLALAFLLFVPLCVFVRFSETDITEQALLERLAELQMKVQYLDSMYRNRQDDLLHVMPHFDQMNNFLSDNETVSSLNELKFELKSHLQLNGSGNVYTATSGIRPRMWLRMPSSYHFLPHLLNDPSSLRLSYLLSRNRNGVSLVMGVPTVRREKQSYLMETLNSLIQNMNPSEMNDTLIVVLVAETELGYVLNVSKAIEQRFPNQVEAGLIEVVAPSASYYPNFQKLRITLGDSPERVRWRSKQNMDFAFLMSYCQPKGTFYVQLEDDILTKPNYITIMKKFAIEKTAQRQPWFVLDFCQLGFIGKLFKSVDLPWLIQFIQMFYNDKPVDWLLDHLITTKGCTQLKKTNCKKDCAKLWFHYKPSLFQHIGMHSSLKGKVQKLKDKQFGRVQLFVPHKNPSANVMSTIKHHQQYTIEGAYLGTTFFWGISPFPGNYIVFNFISPIIIQKFLFRSGNVEHPWDKFSSSTTVEVLPVDTVTNPTSSNNITSDGYFIVGHFDHDGEAEGTPDKSIGKIQALRLTVHSVSENWAILSEIEIDSLHDEHKAR